MLQLRRPFNYFLSPDCALYLRLWKRDGGSFISDDAYGRLCTATGATWGLQGRTFDGIDDYISVPDSASLDLSTLSVLSWFKHSAALTQQTIGAKGAWNGPTTNYALKVYGTQKLAGFVGYTTGWASTLIIGNTTLAVDTWYFGTYTYDLTDSKLYLNGVSDATPITFVATPVVNADVFSIGNWGGGDNGEPFNGRIGEIAVYNRVLTSTEILMYYLATKWRYV